MGLQQATNGRKEPPRPAARPNPMNRPLAVLAVLVAASAGAADFGPEVRECPAAGMQDGADVARRDGRLLVAWRDLRLDSRYTYRTVYTVRALDSAAATIVGEENTTTSPPALAACPDGFA